MEQVKVSIHHSDGVKEIHLRKGLGLINVQKHWDGLEFDCKKGDCGICILKLMDGEENLSDPTEVEADFLKAMGALPQERLACQCRVFGPVSFELEDFGP